MAPKQEKLPRLPSFISCVDDWMDEKKKLEGAEGLWRIHDKLYDFTIWSRIHPGGKFWIDVTRGTDITEAFESHHLSNKAESILQKYYRREATTPRTFFTTFNENEFYKAFKGKAAQQELTITDRHSLGVQLINDFLAVAVFLTGLLGVKNENFWTIASGVLLGVLSVSSHSFFHSKENWRVYYFDLSLMSSRDWKIRHVLSHHSYRGTVSDLEIPLWKPFLENHKTVKKYMQLVAKFIVFFVAAHVQFLQRCFDVLLSKKLGFNLEELVWFSFPLFLFFFGGTNIWEVFVAWNVIVMIGSFCFCLFSCRFCIHSTQTSLKEETQGQKQDFGIVQLSHIGNHFKGNNFIISYLNSFRGNALHYLCPRINSQRLHKFIPVLEDAIKEVGISQMLKSKRFFDELENKIPQGYTFFS